jgi:hypothetical protein
MADDTAGKPPEVTVLAADKEVDFLTGGDGNETLVIDPSVFSAGLTLVEVIADYADGQDMLDLSHLLASLGALPPGNAAGADAATDIAASVSAVAQADANATSPGGSFDEGASLTGVHATISILYDDNQPNHTTTVT